MVAVFLLSATILVSLSPGMGRLRQDSVDLTQLEDVRNLSLTTEPSREAEGDGPSQVAEYECEFTGTLHIWTLSDLSLSLRVENSRTSSTVGRGLGNAQTGGAHLEATVQAGDSLAVTVTSEQDGQAGAVELHFCAAPESEATRDAADLVRLALADVVELERSGDLVGARDVLAEMVDYLAAVPGGTASESISDAFWQIGVRARELADLQCCRSAWSAALKHAERTLPPGHPDLAVNRSNLAVTVGQLGDISSACELLEASLADFEHIRPAGHLDVLNARMNLGSMLAEGGELGRARELHEHVIASAGTGPLCDHPVVLDARANVASIMAETGDLHGARELLEGVLVIRQRNLTADHPDVITTRQNLAVTLELMGDYPAALVNFEAIHEWARRTLPEDHPNAILASQGLAGIMIAIGDLAGARGMCATVLEASQRTLPPDHPNLVRARLNMASTLAALGEYEVALAMLDSIEADGAQPLPKGHPSWQPIRTTRASILAEFGELEQAHALDAEVLAVRERDLPEGHPDLINARSRLAITKMRMGQLAEAETLEEGVLEALEQSLPPGHQDLLRARHNLSFTRTMAGHLDRARELVPAQVAGMEAGALASLALAPRTVGEMIRTNERWLAGLLRLTRDADEAQRAAVFELQETLRMVVLEAGRALRRSDEPVVEAAMREAEAARIKLHEWMASTTRASAGRRDRELTRLTLERDRLERNASRRLAESGVDQRPVRIDALANSMGGKAVALSYRGIGVWIEGDDNEWFIEQHLIAHLLRPDRSLARFDLGSTAEIEALVEAWRPELGLTPSRGLVLPDEGNEPEAGSARALRERLLDPILNAIGKEVERIHVCADDVVFLVPLDALPIGDDHVGDRWSVVNEVSFARLLAPAPKPETEASLLVLGGVDYDAGGRAQQSGAGTTFPPLPHTATEAAAMSRLFESAFKVKAQSLGEDSATKASVFKHAPGRRFLHLATHGWFAPETTASTRDHELAATSTADVRGLAPMLLCGLALAGANGGRDSIGRTTGILTAEELCGLDLSACELAVLSACETNVGVRRAGQGIQSLQSALFAAGARSSITSLWKVDDAATRRLMEVFYTNLWTAKMGKAEALWQAKRALRDEGHPAAHWAGWVLTGDPD